MANFQKFKTTKFAQQLGAEIPVIVHGQISIIKIFLCSIEDFHLKGEIDGVNSFHLDLSVTESEYKVPTLEINDDKNKVYVKFNNLQVELQLTDEGIIADIRSLNEMDSGCIDSAYVFYNELNENDD